MSKHYFDNEVVQGWIEEYLSYPPEERSENPHTQRLKEKIFKEIGKIINGIIFTHKFHVWEPYDDLFQEASEACIKALPKFNPNYITSSGNRATAFNYFSLTAKRSLKFFTMRNKKNRDHLQIEDYSYMIEDDNEANFSRDLISDSFIAHLRVVFSHQKYKKFVPLVDILSEYLHKIGDYNKRDFFRFAKSYGWSPNLIRKFLKIIKDNKERFYTEMSS